MGDKAPAARQVNVNLELFNGGSAKSYFEIPSKTLIKKVNSKSGRNKAV